MNDKELERARKLLGCHDLPLVEVPREILVKMVESIEDARVIIKRYMRLAEKLSKKNGEYLSIICEMNKGPNV